MKLKEASVTRRRWDDSYEENFIEAVIGTYVSLPQTPDDVGLSDRSYAEDVKELVETVISDSWSFPDLRP